MQSTEQYTLELVALGFVVSVAGLVLGVLIFRKLHAVERRQEDIGHGLSLAVNLITLVKRWVHFLVAEKIAGKVEEIRKDAAGAKLPEDTQ